MTKEIIKGRDMLDTQQIIDSLHPLEIAVLPLIEKQTEFSKIVKAVNLQEVEVMRGLQWLQNKQLIEIKETIIETIDLDTNGIKYLEEGGLPEKKILRILYELREAELEQIKVRGISDDEISASIGILKKRAAIEIECTNKTTTLKITKQGEQQAHKESLEEKFLKKRFPCELSSLAPEEKYAYEELRKRKKIIKTSLKKNREYSLTKLGEEIKTLLKKRVSDFLDNVSPEIMRSGKWKNKKFRRYDIKSKVPEISGGRKQHYKWFLDDIREKFLALGFMEMSGPIVESSFWNMDALYMPQFHSARDIHGAYYTKEPNNTSCKNIPEKILARVKQAHEKGIAESKGWKYEFSTKETCRLVLRTQGTACSARILATPELKIPGKYFAIANCFRPDVVDAKHSCDFLQIEGIVIEEGLNLRHLFGLLEMFAREFGGAEKMKIKPGYFPFTEPSAELFIKHPALGWIELGGAGMFRPEVVVPLTGKYVPVLAWGLGIPRLAMQKYQINDIRELNSQDLEYLRTFKIRELI